MPGCGDFSVQAAIQKAAANVGLEPEEVAIITGIGIQADYLVILIHTAYMVYMDAHYH